jgi:hypothetical protein
MNDEAKRKFVLFVGVFGAGVLWLVFGGSVRSTVRAMGARKPSAGIVRAAVPRPVVPLPPPVVLPVAPPVSSPEEIEAAKLAGLLGNWGGTVPRPNLGMCAFKLKLEAGTEKPGFIGYSVLSCANLLQFRPGQRSNPKNANDAMLDSIPVEAILSGSAGKDGSIVLWQDKALGATRAGCNVISITLTPFEGHLQAAWKMGPVNWKESPVNNCESGQLLLSRTNTF